jgi:ABC-type multidrug transport system fused ATPase/permease subunit
MIKVREQAVQRLMQANMRFHDRYPTGDIQSRLSTDAWQAYQLVAWSFFSLIQQPLLMIGGTLYLWTLSPIMALFIVPIGPLLLVAHRLFQGSLYQRAKTVKEMDATLNQYSLETLTGIGQVKAMQLESTISDQYGGLLRRLARLQRREWLSQVGFGWLTDWLANIPFIGIVAVGGIWALAGHFETGTLIAAVQLMNYIIGPFSSVARSWGEVQTGKAALNRIHLMTSAPSEAGIDGISEHLAESSAVAPAVPSQLAPTIRVEDLMFSYSGEGSTLRGLSLTLASGEMTAIMGPNGGGKTTFIKLLLGFYKPDGGHMFWDEREWSEWGVSWIRSHIVYVPQDPFLIGASVADNLRLAKLNSTNDELAAVLDQVGLPHDEEFLQRQPGDRGVQFSGGQRLRLSMARALLRDAPFWILDEPTAALDPDGVDSVVQLIRHLSGPRTLMVVTHTAQVQAVADHVVFIDGGRAFDLAGAVENAPS